MPFPAPTIVPPTLLIGQMSYLGVNFGGLAAGGTYQLVGITGGMDLPPMVSTDGKRALDVGEFAGIDTSAGRDIIIQQLVTGATAAAVETVRQTLGSIMSAQASEQPLYLQGANGLYVCMAKPRKHNFPWDINTLLGASGGNIAGPRSTVVTSAFHATDPRWYAAPTKQTAAIGLPAPLGGLTFNATANFSFGGGGTGGIASVYNNGEVEMRPVIVITGPCMNPVVQNLTTGGSIGVTITLSAGDQLFIDTDLESILYLAAGTTSASDRSGDEMPSNVWWSLSPGLNQIEFTTGDGSQVAATMVVESADAWQVV